METVININQIVKKFNIGTDNELEILHDISFEIMRGQFVSIVGTSGAGKSTLMNILGLLDRPTQGKYILNGMDTSTISEKQMSRIRNREIGFVFQTFNLVSRMNALKNVELPLVYKQCPSKERIARTKKLLEMVGMSDRLYHMPNQLSGGQKQRVSIARAMANDPSIILADEPTGALDTMTGRKIMDIFHSLNKERGKTIILITHNTELAKETDMIITLSDGKIVEVM